MSEPLSFEVMTDRRLTHLENTLTEIQGTLKKLYGAITGDDEFDQLGILMRIRKLESESEQSKSFRNRLVGMATIGGAAGAIIFELLLMLIKK